MTQRTAPEPRLHELHDYRDHDECPRGRMTTFVGHWPASVGGGTYDATRCTCGGWFHTPTADEVFDL